MKRPGAPDRSAGLARRHGGVGHAGRTTRPAAAARHRPARRPPAAGRQEPHRQPSRHGRRTSSARPLIYPGRRAPAPAAAVADATAPPPPPRLTGVIISPSSRRALFASNPGARPRRRAGGRAHRSPTSSAPSTPMRSSSTDPAASSPCVPPTRTGRPQPCPPPSRRSSTPVRIIAASPVWYEKTFVENCPPLVISACALPPGRLRHAGAAAAAFAGNGRLPGGQPQDQRPPSAGSAPARRRNSPTAPVPGAQQSGRPTAAGGNISLDFADTDIRAVVAQILGDILHVNYAIDPAVHGAATFRSVEPLTRTQLILCCRRFCPRPGRSCSRPAASIASCPPPPAPLAGSITIPLHYTSADALVHVLQPIAGNAGKLAADTGRNAIVVTGTPDGEEALADLVRSFDIDLLAGQSYAVLPRGQQRTEGFCRRP